MQEKGFMWRRREFIRLGGALPCAAAAQTFRGGTDVVLAPASVSDRGGTFVRGLGPADFVIHDGGQERTVRLEEEPAPVAMVLALQASFDARRALDRMRKAVSLFGPLVAGENGRAGLIAFRDEVAPVCAVGTGFGEIERSVRNLEARGDGCCLVDAVRASAVMLQSEADTLRRVVVVVSEDRDRSSRSEMQETLELLQRENVTVYALTYSPGWMQFGREVPTGP